MVTLNDFFMICEERSNIKKVILHDGIKEIYNGPIIQPGDKLLDSIVYQFRFENDGTELIIETLLQ